MKPVDRGAYAMPGEIADQAVGIIVAIAAFTVITTISVARTRNGIAAATARVASGLAFQAIATVPPMIDCGVFPANQQRSPGFN